ncbi:unnamed protein product, partial [Urochloa humidicola]
SPSRSPGRTEELAPPTASTTGSSSGRRRGPRWSSAHPVGGTSSSRPTAHPHGGPRAHGQRHVPAKDLELATGGAALRRRSVWLYRRRASRRTSSSQPRRRSGWLYRRVPWRIPISCLCFSFLRASLRDESWPKSAPLSRAGGERRSRRDRGQGAAAQPEDEQPRPSGGGCHPSADKRGSRANGRSRCGSILPLSKNRVERVAQPAGATSSTRVAAGGSDQLRAPSSLCKRA